LLTLLTKNYLLLNNRTFNSFVFYQLCFWALAAYFFAANYILSRTSSFITLDNTSGVCKDTGDDKCCEVPSSVTGEFLADASGRWNTFPKFNYNQNNYDLTLSGVQYTNDDYYKIMGDVNSQVRAMGTRGSNRDYAWNMVAWSAFTALNTDFGSFKFYLAGDAGIIFAKDLIGIGFASNVSDDTPCDQQISTSINPVTRTMTVGVDLGCTNPPCKTNPCPSVLAPQAMGYDTEYASSSIMSFELDLASINTALAVNMGIQKLSNLVSYPGDNSRLSLLATMVRNGAITASFAANVSSYYEPLYAPMTPIYW